MRSARLATKAFGGFVSMLCLSGCITAHEWKYGPNKISPGFSKLENRNEFEYVKGGIINNKKDGEPVIVSSANPNVEHVKTAVVDTTSAFTWPSYATGAVIVNGDNRACLQTALAAKSEDSGAIISVTPGEELPGAEALAAIVNLEEITKLSEKNAVATMVDSAMFHLCTIASNNNLSDEHIVSMVNAIMWAAKGVAEAGAMQKPDPKPAGGGSQN